MERTAKLHIFRDNDGDWQLEWRDTATGDIGEWLVFGTHAEAVAAMPDFVIATA